MKNAFLYMINIYPGLFVTFMNGSTDDLLKQIHETRKLDSTGFVLFDYAHFDNKYVDVLMAGAFNIKNYEEPQIKEESVVKNTSKKRFKNKK